MMDPFSDSGKTTTPPHSPEVDCRPTGDHGTMLACAIEGSHPPSTPIVTQPLSKPLHSVNSLSKGILKAAETPGSGRSVRFGSRNAYRLFTPASPNTSLDHHSADVLFSSSHQETPKVGIECNVQSVGKGRPSVSRTGSSSSSSSSGSQIEHRLKELYLAGKQATPKPMNSNPESNHLELSLASSHQNHPSSVTGTSFEMPSEGAFQHSQFTDLLQEDQDMLNHWPDGTDITLGSLSTQQCEYIQHTRQQQISRIHEESTVHGMLEAVDHSQVEDSDIQAAEKSAISGLNRYGSVANLAPPVESDSRIASQSSRISSVRTDGSFDVFSHYSTVADESAGLRVFSRSNGEDSSRQWPPVDTSLLDHQVVSDTHPEIEDAHAARTHNKSSTVPSGEVVGDESDRSIGVMIVHDDVNSISASENEPARSEVSYEDRQTVLNASLSMRMPGKFRQSFIVHSPVKIDRSQLEQQLATPIKALDDTDKTVFWTPGSALDGLSFPSNEEADSLTSGSSPSPSLLCKQSLDHPIKALTRSAKSLGHILIAAEDDVIDELRVQVNMWKEVAGRLEMELKQAKEQSLKSSVTLNQVMTQSEPTVVAKDSPHVSSKTTDKLLSKIDRLKTQNSVLRGDRDELDRHRHDLEKAFDGLRIERSQLELQVHDATQQRSEALSELESIKMVLEETKQREMAANSHTIKMEEEIAQHERSNTAMEQEVVKLTRERDDAIEQRLGLETEYKDVSARQVVSHAILFGIQVY